jgi:bla regulator protein BlaR1
MLEDFSRFFNGLDGSFVLYDLNKEVYTIHNMEMSTTRVSPNSTYKIVSALIALETEILEADNSFQQWNGTIHPFEAWNQNQHLTSAMQNSVNWYFQNFDTAVGMERLQYYLSELSYGNFNLSGGADFWIESSLRISPLEQVDFLRNFYQDNTVFSNEHSNTLRDVLRLQERNGAVLSGKTGTGSVNGNITNGWFVGYVETSDNTFVFATYIQGEDNAGGSVAAQIALSILEEMKIF